MQITVCPSCQTSLYITDEQLRQAQGKVKCGRCLTIFDAVAHLKSDSEQNARDLFSAEFSENQPVAVKTDEVEVPTQSQQSEDNLSFSFSLPSGSSSALSGVSVRDTMRMTTDSLYSPRERQSIFSSEEISLDDPDEHLDRESLLSDFVLALEESEEDQPDDSEPEQQGNYAFQPEEEILSGQKVDDAYFVAPDSLQEADHAVSVEEEKIIRMTQQQVVSTPFIPVEASKTERMLFTGIVAALCCLVVQIIGSFFISVPASYSEIEAVSTLSANVNLQDNRLFLSVKASQPIEKVKGKTMYLSLVDAEGKIMVQKAIPPERYLAFAKNEDGRMLLDMTLFARQPMSSFTSEVYWLP